MPDESEKMIPEYSAERIFNPTPYSNFFEDVAEALNFFFFKHSHPDCKFMILKHVPLLESLHSAERSMIDYMRIQQEYKIVNKK